MNVLRNLYSPNQIKKEIISISQLINDTYWYSTEELVLVGILKGSFMFLSDLSRQLRVNHSIDFISISSYGESGREQEEVKFLLDTSSSIKGKNVLIVEDIIDSGTTIDYLVDVFKSRGANSIKVCTLLKRESSKAKTPIDFCGIVVPDGKWVVGYGMDYKEKYRNLIGIYELEEKN